MRITTAALAIITAISGPLIAGETPSAPGAEVYFVNLEDGDTVKGPVKVVFGLSGMGVAPAGTEADNTGHHHLLINRAPFGDGPDDAEMLEYGVYADDNHVYFGKGQTETTVDLAPGQHSLQLLLGDLNHAPHDSPVMSDVITITVE